MSTSFRFVFLLDSQCQIKSRLDIFVLVFRRNSIACTYACVLPCFTTLLRNVCADVCINQCSFQSYSTAFSAPFPLMGIIHVSVCFICVLCSYCLKIVSKRQLLKYPTQWALHVFRFIMGHNYIKQTQSMKKNPLNIFVEVQVEVFLRLLRSPFFHFTPSRPSPPSRRSFYFPLLYLYFLCFSFPPSLLPLKTYHSHSIISDGT